VREQENANRFGRAKKAGGSRPFMKDSRLAVERFGAHPTENAQSGYKNEAPAGNAGASCSLTTGFDSNDPGSTIMARPGNGVAKPIAKIPTTSRLAQPLSSFVVGSQSEYGAGSLPYFDVTALDKSFCMFDGRLVG
jgi:hypothetical protein